MNQSSTPPTASSKPSIPFTVMPVRNEARRKDGAFIRDEVAERLQRGAPSNCMRGLHRGLAPFCACAAIVQDEADPDSAHGARNQLHLEEPRTRLLAGRNDG